MKKICDITERLLERFGDRLTQVERLSEHTYRATLNDGGVLHAVELQDGRLMLQSPEGAWTGA